MENKSNRNYNIDVVRIFALFCVISVHFFLKSGFYDVTIVGKKMYLMVIFRSLFMVCVPLFICLTGFLMCNKVLSLKYYKRLLSVIITYIICSIIYSIFAKYYMKGDMNTLIFFKNLFSYKGTPYGWYIEMYIGLFLIIPFLNMIVNGIDNKKNFQMLMITLIILISLPGMTNIYNIESLEWWKNPSVSSEYFKVLPSWWVPVYPVLYYFLGAYLRKFNIKENKKKIILFLIIVVLLNGSFCFYRSHNSAFVNGTWNDYYSIFTFIQTFLIFTLILNLNVKIENKIVRYILEKISSATLGAYLLSYIFDYIFYRLLASKVPDVTNRFIYAPIIVILVFTSSLALSSIAESVRTAIIKIIKKLFNQT